MAFIVSNLNFRVDNKGHRVGVTWLRDRVSPHRFYTYSHNQRYTSYLLQPSDKSVFC